MPTSLLRYSKPVKQLLRLRCSLKLANSYAASSPVSSLHCSNDGKFKSPAQLAYQNYRYFSSNGSGKDDGSKGKDVGAKDGEGGNGKDKAEETALVEKVEDILNTGASMSTITVPENWPIVPVVAVNRYPLFPGFIKKVDIVQDDALKELLRRKVKMRQPYVGVFVKKDDENKAETVASLSDLYSVGSFAQIIEFRDLGAIVEVILSAQRRIRILESVDDNVPDGSLSSGVARLNGRRTAQQRRSNKISKSKEKAAKDLEQGSETPPLEPSIILARTENFIADPVENTVEMKATMQAIVQTIRDIVQYNPLFGQQINLLLHPSQNVVDNPIYLCDLVATLVQSADTLDLQEMMQEISVKRRLEMALLLVEKEKTLAKLKHDINKDVERKVQEQHRKYLLNEQLKAIKKELGIEKEDKVAIAEKMEERIKDLKIPEYVMKVIKEEQAKLSNYLDWLTGLPWGKTSKETLDLDFAMKVLDEDHYGMKDVKERILEFIAVGILKKKVGGKILCFYGPPGVGKTSIAKSIARALNRQYFRFSVGGMTDVAEIKGHRRTYVGAMPGKMIQCLKKVQTENPLVLIDEVDKIGGAGFHGDPASALLELLDPEQNHNFNDHFLDVPVDLSKVLFICTANVVDTIPGPLRDRMEMIEVSGYVAEEKLSIATNYLIPQCRTNSSLVENQLVIKEDSLQTLIKQYCRESGVRNLQKLIEKIFRKVAFRIASAKLNDSSLPLVVDSSNLEEFVGRPKFTSDRLYDETPVGVVMGLAWTAMGGSALYIEAALSRCLTRSGIELNKSKKVFGSVSDKTDSGTDIGEGSLKATGHLGDVMKESIQTAYTVAKNIIFKKFPSNNFLEKAHIHVHVPEGATPKDGPSAGCTITSALLSLALDKPARQNIAMTGEITLTGRILPVGGIKEKIIAAKRAGVNCVILPKENQRDFDDLPDFVKKDVEIHFVTNYDEVFNIIFPCLS
uniref:Lon protease homolog, mitochondrial n=1 Tax=Syphacia muris TaxID=451379 RepID=A0A0N5A8M5_9BILA